MWITVYYRSHLENPHIWLVELGSLDLNIALTVLLLLAIVSCMPLVCHNKITVPRCAMRLQHDVPKVSLQNFPISEKFHNFLLFGIWNTCLHVCLLIYLRNGFKLWARSNLEPCMARCAIALGHKAWFWDYLGLIVWTMPQKAVKICKLC